MLPSPGDLVCAGVDTGMRHDSSALVIVHRRGDVLTVADLVELQPQHGQALKPSHVFRTFVDVMRQHGCTYAVGDNNYRDAFVEFLEEASMSFVPGPSDIALPYVRTRALMRDGRLRLPKHEKLLRQLRQTQGVVTAGGRMSIQNPRNRGGHGDLVSALVLAVYQIAVDETPAVAPAVGTPEWEEAAREARRAAYLADKDRPWWQVENPIDRGDHAWWRK